MSSALDIAARYARPAPKFGALRGPTFCDGEDTWQPGCGFCGSCGGPLPLDSKKRWFCSKDCQRWWRENHQWREARDAALRRDRTCVHCHRGNALRQMRQRRGARLSAAPADRARMKANEVRLEVNHKDALADSVVGSGAYETSCEHHLSGLETMCKDCHQEETTRQLRDRTARQREAMIS